MRNKRILCFLLCFMFLFFVGCDGGPGGFEDDTTPSSLDGVKVLTKPSEYSFEEAVGQFSVYYYNIFAREILNSIYEVYENPTLVEPYKREEFYINSDGTPFDDSEGYTFHVDGNSDSKIYYLYDNLRYTISQVNTKTFDTGAKTQTLTLNFNSAWNWTLKKNAAGTNKAIFFKNINMPIKDNEVMFTLSPILTDWTSPYVVSLAQIPNFKEFYTDVKGEGSTEEVTTYYNSPYYQKVVEGKQDAALTAVNFFQDAMEYATYLIVLGYDFENEDDAVLFDFVIDYDTVTTSDTYGHVKGMKVNGWETNPIDIVDALGRVKALYEENGNYVGVTETNKEKIATFVKKVVIGDEAMKLDKFSVKQTISQPKKDLNGNIEQINGATVYETIEGEALKFNRNYEQIIDNVVEYACGQAPIGYVDGKKLTLSDSYLTSKITDYSGDYFFMSYDDNDDSEMFQYIEAAEYQSMVLYPQDVDVNMAIGDLVLAFEYCVDPVPEKNLKFLPEITINVGFRYFDHLAIDEETGKQGAYTTIKECQKTIKYGKNGSFEDEDPDVHWLTISDTDTIGPDIQIGENVVIKTQFDRNIGGGVINPFSPIYADEQTSLLKRSITISGTNNARKYYSLNNSSSYGVYGTLNGAMFAGEGGCDFIEVYFDVVKDKGKSGINYNYKVGILNFTTNEEN